MFVVLCITWVSKKIDFEPLTSPSEVRVIFLKIPRPPLEKSHIPWNFFVLQPTVACLLKALSEISMASGSTAIAKASLSYTGQLVSAVLPSRSRLSWDLDVHNPELVLPEWGVKEK